MANVEGDSPNFDELRVLGGEPAAESEAAPTDETAAEPLAEEAVGSPLAAETTPPEGEPAEAAEAEEPAGGVEEKDEEEEPSRLPLYLEVAGLIVVPLIVLGLAMSKDLGLTNSEVLSIWTAIYLIALGLIPYALWKSRETSTLYTVFLGCVLAAMLTGVYCLWMELGRYQYDINAQEAKRKVGMLFPAEPGLPAPFSLPGGPGGLTTLV